MRFLLVLLSVLCYSLLLPAFAKENVTFIYVHGVRNQNPSSFYKEANELHKEIFKKCQKSDIAVAEDFRILYWGEAARYKKPFSSKEIFNVAQKDGVSITYQKVDSSILNAKYNKNHSYNNKSYDSFLAGIYNINNQYKLIKADSNDSKWKNFSKTLYEIVVVPLSAIVPHWGGSTPNIVATKNAINDFVFDAFWVNENKNDLNTSLYNCAEAINGPYVIVAHSAGSIVALNFIDEYINKDKQQPEDVLKVKSNFKGIITMGSPANVVLQEKMIGIAQNIQKNDSFWLDIANCNDLVANGINNNPDNTNVSSYYIPQWHWPLQTLSPRYLVRRHTNVWNERMAKQIYVRALKRNEVILKQESSFIKK